MFVFPCGLNNYICINHYVSITLYIYTDKHTHMLNFKTCFILAIYYEHFHIIKSWSAKYSIKWLHHHLFSIPLFFRLSENPAPSWRGASRQAAALCRAGGRLSLHPRQQNDDRFLILPSKRHNDSSLMLQSAGLNYSRGRTYFQGLISHLSSFPDIFLHKQPGASNGPTGKSPSCRPPWR